MTISDILVKCGFEKIKEKLILHYGNNDIDKYEQLYNTLLQKIKSDLKKSDFYIYITAYNETEYDNIKIENFSENDAKLNFDISGYETGDNTVYSISSAEYDEFLTYNIDRSTLEKFSIENILAHCFYEITAYGFEDNV